MYKVFSFKDMPWNTIERYYIVSNYIGGMDIAEFACATGYGTTILAEKAKHVTAIDIDVEAIAFAKTNWNRGNIDYIICDIKQETTMPQRRFDAVVALEAIEHIKYPFTRTIIELKKIVSPKGLLILSFPCGENAAPHPEGGEHHCHVGIKNDSVCSALTENDFTIQNIIQQGVPEITGGYSQTIIVSQLNR